MAEKKESAVEIPVVDFGKFLHGSEEERKACATELVNAYKQYGFAYIVNHGVSKELRESMREQAAKYFALPLEEKMKMDWVSPESNRGYSCIGREVLDMEKSVQDIKEMFEVGKEGEDKFENRWPPEELLPEFKAVSLQYWKACFNLHLEILRAFALELGLPLDFFDKGCGAENNNLRMLHYPATENHTFIRAGPHTDYGTITLLMQDDVGGLEVLGPDGETWIPATPIEDAYVVNCGDLMKRWTNDTFNSNVHRVVCYPGAHLKERYSFAYFCNPNKTFPWVVDMAEA